jgi:4-amino-4-deoxy-L-arabinose transferase-like glycosyltransferase
MLEAGSTFFALLILWTYLRLQNRLQEPKSLLLGALVGVGILSKETTLSVIMAILLLGIVLRRFKPTLLWVLLLIIPSIVWQGYATLT